MSSKNIAEQALQDPNLVKITSLLKDQFSPVKMYLFGSRVTPHFREDSDYDIVLVVKNRQGTRLENMQKARILLFEHNLLGDVFVYTQEEFNDWKDEFSSIPETALNTGIEVPLAN